MRNDSALMYTCSLIEFIGRNRLLPRREVVATLGNKNLRRIYTHADVLHCEHIGNVADAYIEIAGVGTGTFDNVGKARYLVPDYWTIGQVFERLVEDVCPEGADVVDVLLEVYDSWISDAISNYNTDFYYQPRDYIRECYLAGEVL